MKKRARLLAAIALLPAVAWAAEPLVQSLTENEEKIVDELNSVQGKSVDIGGYYIPDAETTTSVMRPSATFNAVLASLQG